jgi:PKD repeat protein
MTYDVADGYYLLYGGTEGTSVYGDTYSFTTSGGWTKLGPSTTPPTLTEPGMVFDTSDSKVLMFGGCEGLSGCPDSETWTFSGGNWAQYTKGTAPTAVLAPGMAYDTNDGYTVLFGGCSGINFITEACSAYADGTYTFTSANGWQSVSTPSGLTARVSPNMAYDPLLKEVLLYGGYDGTNDLSDMWAFSGGAWSKLSPTSTPGGSSDGAMFWDSSLNEMILFGGDDSSGTASTTWAYANGGWTQLFPSAYPSARDSMMDAAAPTGLPIVFDGSTDNGSGSDTWAFGTPPSAQITVSPTVADVGDSVTLSASVSGDAPPYSLSWNLGDGTTSTSGNLTHSYTKAGLYTVKFTATDSYGLSATQSKTVNISALPSLTAAASPLTIYTGNHVSFWANATGGMAPLKYAWSFGDGSNSTTADPTHTYTTQGTYEAMATVTDSSSLGHCANAAVNITVKVPVGALSVTFAASPTSGLIPLPVTFTSTVSGGTAPYTYKWTFGDGSPGSTAPDPSHTFNTSGVFIVNLNVSDNAGHSQASVTQITTHSGPMSVTASVTPTHGVAPLVVSFMATPVGGLSPYTYLWNFNDGVETSTAPDPTHTYNGSRIYNASVTVADSLSDGQKETVNIYNITVYSAITVSVIGPATAEPNTTVTFTAHASGGNPPYNYSWTFGAGAAPTGENQDNSTTHSFASAGNSTTKYLVVVNVTDSLGYSALAETNITIEVAKSTPPGGASSSTPINIFGSELWLVFLLIPVMITVIVAAVIAIVTGRHKYSSEPGPGNYNGGGDLRNFREPPYYPGSGWE